MPHFIPFSSSSNVEMVDTICEEYVVANVSDIFKTEKKVKVKRENTILFA